MAHDLYDQYGQQQADVGFAQMAEKINQFTAQYRGDPYAEAEAMIRAGRITREQWERALGMARQIRPHLGRR